MSGKVIKLQPRSKDRKQKLIEFAMNPKRDGRGIYLEWEGEKIRLSPMQANMANESWSRIVGGFMVHLTQKMD